MKNLNISSYGVEEMTRQEIKTVNGGRKIYMHEGGNPLIYFGCAIANAYTGIKAWIQKDETVEVVYV